MGNEVSQQGEDRQFHEEAVTSKGITLESPEADKYLNQGTAASNCQPSHTQSELNAGQNLVLEEGLEVVMKDRNETSENGKSQPLSPKHRRDSGVSDSGQDERRKRQHMTEQEQQQAAAKKLTYVQMAKMGYQELVNAIIRPPRADYKVSTIEVPCRVLSIVLKLLYHSLHCTCFLLCPVYRWKLWVLPLLTFAGNGLHGLISPCGPSGGIT